MMDWKLRMVDWMMMTTYIFVAEMQARWRKPLVMELPCWKGGVAVGTGQNEAVCLGCSEWIPVVSTPPKLIQDQHVIASLLMYGCGSLPCTLAVQSPANSSFLEPLHSFLGWLWHVMTHPHISDLRISTLDHQTALRWGRSPGEASVLAAAPEQKGQFLGQSQAAAQTKECLAVNHHETYQPLPRFCHCECLSIMIIATYAITFWLLTIYQSWSI